MQYTFGSGNLYGLVTSGATLVPRKFGTLQDVSLEFNRNIKELYGQLEYPVALAGGQRKITGKAKAANINAGAWNDIYLQGTQSAVSPLAIIGEAGSIPATPFQVTVSQGALFADDLGVVFTATGVPLTRVPTASTPTTGQYKVSAAGVYTFAAVDTLLAVLIDYSYTPASGGQLITLTNNLVGSLTSFVGVFNMKYNNKQLQIRLNSCYSGKLSLASKIEDFMIPEFDFMAAADAAGIIGTIGMAE